jgi:hypothetical protein
MDRPNRPALRLSREIVRELQEPELAPAVGGALTVVLCSDSSCLNPRCTCPVYELTYACTQTCP